MATAQSVPSKKITSKTAAPTSAKKPPTKKLIAKTPAVKKSAAATKIIAKKKSTPQTVKPSSAANKATGKSTVAPEERYKMIAAAAYLRAEQRGFTSGRALNDWIEAEAEIDAMIKA